MDAGKAVGVGVDGREGRAVEEADAVAGLGDAAVGKVLADGEGVGDVVGEVEVAVGGLGVVAVAVGHLELGLVRIESSQPKAWTGLKSLFASTVTLNCSF